MTNEKIIALSASPESQERLNELFNQLLKGPESNDISERIRELFDLLLRAADVGWQEAVRHISEEPGQGGISPAFGPRTPFTTVSTVTFTEDE